MHLVWFLLLMDSFISATYAQMLLNNKPRKNETSK